MQRTRAAQRDEMRKGQAYLGMFKSLSPAYAAELEDVELVDLDLAYHGSAEIDWVERVCAA